MNAPPRLATLTRLGCGLLWLVSCGGSTQSSQSTGQDDEAASEAAAKDATELMRSVPERCDRALEVSCVTSGDHDGCAHHARSLIESAQAAGCLRQARAALDCVEREQAECSTEGRAQSPAACAPAVDDVNACINSATDWSSVGCTAYNEPGTDGGPDACEVTCGNFAANCRSEGGVLHCVCTSGVNAGRLFEAGSCPSSSALASACSYRDVL